MSEQRTSEQIREEIVEARATLEALTHELHQVRLDEAGVVAGQSIIISDDFKTRGRIGYVSNVYPYFSAPDRPPINVVFLSKDGRRWLKSKKITLNWRHFTEDDQAALDFTVPQPPGASS